MIGKQPVRVSALPPRTGIHLFESRPMRARLPRCAGPRVAQAPRLGRVAAICAFENNRLDVSALASTAPARGARN